MNLARNLLHVGARGISRAARRSYRAASLSAFGGQLEIVDKKEKRPHDGEVLLEVANAGFNDADISMIEGKYHLIPTVPFVPGFEVAGTVIAVGKGVKRFKEGDRVIALRTEATGAFAEQCMLSAADIIMTIPYSMNFEVASSLSVSYGTAYMALQKMASERQGSSVLVLASKGTIGLAAIDLAQNVFKAQVFGASDSEEKLEKLRATGVQSTLNWTDGRLATNIKKATFGQGVDLIIDTVGGKPFEDALAGLKIGGNVISVGFSSGVIPSISLLELHRLQATISGIWLGGRPQLEVEKVISSVIGLYDEGYLSVGVEKKYALEKINECIKDVREQKVFGKAIIDMR
ncbi:Quinone oxidoreductase-like protein 2 -like protein [Toxocara canis]|uniref:Quinone oxidoreductase-like protein 2-like protein n=1 Tax=Toxocara canis TaxID=6265 RepID=A0A0B2VLU5_TOXCA|nr:Quinone oxidoreductase-like protein 2 -like protein [Toxocara canis]